MTSFDPIASEVSSRVTTCRSVVGSLHGTATSHPTYSQVFRGLIFVQMYALYEFTLSSAVRAAIEYVNASGRPCSQIRESVLSLLLAPEWLSAADAAPKRRWQVRSDLATAIRSPAVSGAFIDSTFPDDGSHFRTGQIATIWHVFGITAPLVPDQRLLQRIDELVENRNAIAHGRMTPEEVGKRYSPAEIAERVDDTESIVTHIISTMETQCTSGGLFL
jgi:hypothetical protein